MDLTERNCRLHCKFARRHYLPRKERKKTMLNSNERHRLMARLSRAILPVPAAHKSSGTEIKARIDRR